jgi:hypothetical protein
MYARRAFRMRLHCVAMVTPAGREGMLGEVTDISVRGIGVEVPRPLDTRSKVNILVDPGAVGTTADGGLPSLPGTVRVVRKVASRADGHIRYHLGVAFHSLSPHIVGRLRSLVAPHAERAGYVGPTLPTDGAELRNLVATGPGRESLLQNAHELLAAGLVAAAREAIVLAVRFEPSNRHYQSFLHRVMAEEAILAGEISRAETEAAAARSFAPEDEELDALDARLRSPGGRPRRKSLIFRILGK